MMRTPYLFITICFIAGCFALPDRAAHGECILASRYGAATEGSGRTWELLRRRLPLFEGLDAIARGGEFYELGQGKIALDFQTDCVTARSFIVRRIETLAAETDDDTVAAELRNINANWREIDREDYETISSP